MTITKTDEPVKNEPINEPNNVPKEEPKKEEPKQEPAVKSEPAKVEPIDNSKDIENLRAEITDLTEKANKVEAITLENENLKNDISTRDNQIKVYEELITKLVETKLEQVPEEYKELIPDNLNLVQKLSWLDKAEAKGIFNKEEKKKPNVEIGKPMNLEQDNIDTGKLSGSQLLRLAYNTIKK